MTLFGPHVRVVLCAAASALVVALAGCGGSTVTASNPSASSASSSTSLQWTAPASGDVSQVTWDLPYGEPISLDPLKAYGYSENTVLSNVCEGLLRLAPNGTSEPALAQSVAHPDPKTWVYTLRSGVMFSDGAPLTPNDVVFSIRRHLNPALGSFYANPWAGEIASVNKQGANKVVLRTVRPNRLINGMMTTGLGTVVEAASVRREGKNFGTPSGFPVCSGPFRVQSWVPGASLTLVRNDRYWDPARRAHAARFTFQFVTDQNALVNALTTGAIDGTYEAPVAAVAKLRSSATGKLVLGQTSTQGLGLVPTTSRAVADPRVREALSLVIDRRGIANSAFSGAAQPSLSFADPVYSSYAKPQLAAWYATLGDAARNPTRAKTLLSQAGGVHSPLRLVFQAGDPALAETANAIQSEAQGIGLPITLVQLQPQQFVGLFFDRHARRSYDLMLAPTYGDMFDPLQFALIAMVPTSVTDIAGFNDPQVTSLIYQGIATTDLNLAAQDIVKIAAIAQRDVQPDIPLLHLPERLFLSNKLTGAPVSFPYFYYPWAAPIGAAKG